MPSWTLMPMQLHLLMQHCHQPRDASDEQSTQQYTTQATKVHNRPSQLSRALRLLLTQEWHSGHVTTEWQDRILLFFHKGKGSRPECSNYCPISQESFHPRTPQLPTTTMLHSLTSSLPSTWSTARRCGKLFTVLAHNHSLQTD